MTGFVGELAAISGLAEEIILQHALVFLRIAAAMALLPAFGEQVVPVRVRLALALAFTAVVAPAVMPGLPHAAELGMGMFASETLSGLALGFALRLFVHALQIAGAIIAQATSLAQVFAGAGPEPLPAVGHLLIMSGLALAVAAGLHIRAAEYLILSYDVFPAGRMPAASEIAGWGLERIARAFALGFSLAAPFTIASLLYNLAIGVINRAMPQLMVSFVGAPALTAGGLVLLALGLPFVLAVWLGLFKAFLAAPFGAG